MREKVKKLAEKKGLLLKDLAQRLGITYQTLHRKLNGDIVMDLDTLEGIAKELDTTVGYLLDEVKEESNQTKPHISTDIIFVPVMSNINTVCCGEGNIYDIAEEAVEYMIPVAAAALGPICTEGLFAVKAEGDSMTGAKIHEGDLVVVAPHEEPFNGSVVFVCYGPQKRWMLRWYYASPDGSILLKAANPAYPDIEVTKEYVEAGWYEYVGRVVAIHSTPRVGL